MRIISILLFLLSFQTTWSQDFSAYESHYFNDPHTLLPYRLLRPLNPDSPPVRYPLIIFLHGAYSKGNDNAAQLFIGGAFFLRDSVRKNYSSYVLFPQCPEGDLWAEFTTRPDASGKEQVFFPFKNEPTDISAALMNLVDSLVHHLPIDSQRVYIGGYSQGGMGVLDLLARYSRRFAAGFSIAGAGNVKTSSLFAGSSSLWLMHGEKDDVIPVEFSRSWYKRLKKLNADVRYSEYAGVGHNSWSNAFAEPQLLSWLFSRHKRL